MVPPPTDVALPASYNDLPYEHIKCSHQPESSTSVTPVVVLTLNRPKTHNAFTGTMMRELEQVFQLFDLDDRVRCVVVTGAGRTFCAGADLTPGQGAFQGGLERTNDHRDGYGRFSASITVCRANVMTFRGGRVALAIYNCRKPVIGAIQGAAVGVGITMTLPMSIRIAYRDAKVGFVFSRRGLVMEACSSFFLPRLIGLSRAMHLVTTGAVHRASEPIFGGLFSETLDAPDKVLPRALELADEIAKNTSVVSYELMKQMIWRNPGSPEGTHLLDSKLIYSLFSTSWVSPLLFPAA